MLSPSIALILSIVAILVLIRLKVHPGFAIFIGSLTLSMLVLPVQTTPSLMFEALWAHQVPLGEQQTLKLLIVIASALTLSSLMEEKGLLANLAVAMESIGSRLAIHVVPAIIGFVPMPGGALVSATTMQGLARRLGLTPEQSTFINYWFRHLWEFTLPVYPSIIITSVLLGTSLFSVVKTLAPITALSIVCGAAISYWILRKKTYKTKGGSPKKIAINFLKAAWPILLLVPTILSGLNPMIVFPVILVLLALQQRVSWPELWKALKYGLNLKILFLLYSVMLFKVIIERADAAGALISDMQAIGLPPVLMLAVLPLLIGLATGISMAFVGVALPLLLPYIALDSGISSSALLLAFTSGMMGILVSPLHLCLILSSEYFKATLAKVYRYVLPPVLVIEATVILVYLIAGS